MFHPENSIYPGTADEPPPEVCSPGTADEPPPEVCSPGDIAKNNPPPSYDSLFGKIKKAKEESSGNVDFARKCCTVCTGSVIFALVLCFILAFLISMIVIGAVYLDDCRAESRIPIFLLVHGCVSIVLIVFGFLSYDKNSKEKEKTKPKTNSKKRKNADCLSHLISFFLIAWFLFGCSIVYELDWVSSPVNDKRYCHPTVYYFAFWSVTSVFIFMLSVLAICFCICAIACCTGKK